jgi:hypothetical protein
MAHPRTTLQLSVYGGTRLWVTGIRWRAKAAKFRNGRRLTVVGETTEADLNKITYVHPVHSLSSKRYEHSEKAVSVEDAIVD